VTIAQTLQHSNTWQTRMSIKLTTTQTKHKPIYTYTYRQKPLKLLKIKKGPIDKTFHATSRFDSWQRISVTSRSQVVSLRSRTCRLGGGSSGLRQQDKQSKAIR